MNSTDVRDAELNEAKTRRNAALERRKDTARRAYEAGEMSPEEIGRLVHADSRTLKRWIAEGKWERKP